MKVTKHYLFDFDGTLVDSMPYWAGAMLDVLDTYGIKYSDDIIRIITPLGSLGTAEYFQKLGLDLTIEEIRNIYDQCVVGGRPLVVKMGEAVNVCCHIYSNIALNSIAFLYMGLSSGKPCLSRHGYDMLTGSHTSSKYYLVKEG